MATVPDKKPPVYVDQSKRRQAQIQLQGGSKITQELIDSLYPEGDPTNYAAPGHSANARQTLIGLLNKQSQNLPERVGAGGDALEQLYKMIPVRLKGFGRSGVFDENEALREQTKTSIFNLEQTAKAEKLKSRKKDKVAFGGKASTPERKIPLASTVSAEGTLLGGGSALGSSSNNKTLLGG